MAYAAIMSLQQTMEKLAVSVVQYSLENEDYFSPQILKTIEILVFGNNNLNRMLRVLKRLDDSSRRSNRLNALDGQIKDEVQKLEDYLDFHISNQFLFQSENYADEGFYSTLSVQINSFVETTKKMEEEYVGELDHNCPVREEDEDEDEDVSSISPDFGVDMVGFSDEIVKIKKQLLQRTRPFDFHVCSIVGVAGSGRTVAAKTIFEDLYSIRHEQPFDCGAWVTIGATYQLKEILVSILAQVDPSSPHDELLISEGNEEEICEYLYASLKGRRYLIVLDDLRDTEIRDMLPSLLPTQDNGSLVMLTTSLTEVALVVETYHMPTLNDGRFWDYLRLGLLGNNPCPPQFEEAGRKIAENCEGIRILLAKVILVLFKAEKTPEYWNKVAADIDNCIFTVADELSEICKIKEELQQCTSYGNEDERRWATSMITSLLDFSPGITGIKTILFPERLFPKMQINSIIGMAGIGKTTLLKKIFYDQSILHKFDHCVWITLGPKYQPQEILVDILSHIHTDIDKMHLRGDEKLVEDLCRELSDKRCLIVLDDVWNQEPLHYLKRLWPDIKGKALVTSRIKKVGNFGPQDWVCMLRFLSKEESWSLLCQKVFAEESCPYDLQNPGEKIAEKCDGLPLLILTVANLLSKAEKTLNYWNNVAENDSSSIFLDAQNEISKILVPSYKNLPQHIKACFLYMGIFPQNCEILTSKLVKLWIAEGFFETHSSKPVERLAADCFLELLDRNLVIIRQKGTTFAKTCGLHSVFWHMSNREAAKNNFFHALSSYGIDTSVQGIESQRRLCIRNSVLLAIKDWDKSMTSISTVRSLLCTGQPHQYPVPICLGLRLLRVLDALTIRLYEFPVEVVELIHLRFLALTCNGDLPSSISKLRNLEYLIVRQHLSIMSSGDLQYAPLEIWDLKNLKHLQIMGSNLLHDPNCGTPCPKLSTLLDVNADSCAQGILERIPNLMRLGIRVEIAPDDDGNPFSFLKHISHLSVLVSLKCILVNPDLSHSFARPSLSTLPSSLQHLHLSGLGYPWEDMSAIALLPNLEVLKLRCYAFQGPIWEACSGDFQKLKRLYIEDTDLVHWKIKQGSFPKLESLCIKHCYNIEGISWEYSDTCRLIEKFHILESNPTVVTWAKHFNSIFKGMQENTRSIDCELDSQDSLVLASFDPTTSGLRGFF